MRIGIIARADKTGLGQGQTLRLVKLLKPDRVMVIDSTPIKKPAPKQYHEWYKGYNTTNVYGLPTTQDVDKFLNDVDIIISCETFYSYYFVSEAKKRGVKSVLIFNYEFLDNLLYSNIAMPDILIQPSYWYLDDMAERFGAVYLPTPIFPDEFAKARETNLKRKNTRHYLFMNGKTAANDRNGLNSLYAALKYAKGDFTITVKAQNDIEQSGDARVTYDFSNPENQNDLYEGFDALILPRRYAGQALPMCEALCAGLPVVMTDIDPNNKVLPPEWLVSARKIDRFMVRAMIDVYDADPINLAMVLDTLDAKAKAKAKAIELSKEYDPIALLPKYKQALGL